MEHCSKTSRKKVEDKCIKKEFIEKKLSSKQPGQVWYKQVGGSRKAFRYIGAETLHPPTKFLQRKLCELWLDVNRRQSQQFFKQSNSFGANHNGFVNSLTVLAPITTVFKKKREH